MKIYQIAVLGAVAALVAGCATDTAETPADRLSAIAATADAQRTALDLAGGASDPLPTGKAEYRGAVAMAGTFAEGQGLFMAGDAALSADFEGDGALTGVMDNFVVGEIAVADLPEPGTDPLRQGGYRAIDSVTPQFADGRFVITNGTLNGAGNFQAAFDGAIMTDDHIYTASGGLELLAYGADGKFLVADSGASEITSVAIKRDGVDVSAGWLGLVAEKQ